MKAYFQYWINALRVRKNKPGLYYIAPNANWSLDWDAHYITRDLSKKGIDVTIQQTAEKLFGEVVHFASLWEVYAHRNLKTLRFNKVIATIFHGDPTQTGFVEPFADLQKRERDFSRFVVSCSIMEKRLAALGLPPSKIIRIPLGVDLSRFSVEDQARRRDLRKGFGIPEGAFVIGSFQKDGVGMAEGLEPKSIKGPDIFLRTIEQVNKVEQVFVLLSGPARGYVKQGLEKLGIPYRHVLLQDYLDIPSVYQAADLYLMTSREEGGPKGVLEAQASGVPLVATRVGLAPDVITHEENGLLADSEDVAALTENTLRLIAEPALARRLANKALETIQAYDWSLIAERYYREVYQPILDSIDD